MDLKETEILGADIDRHWYYAAKAQAVSRFLGEVVPATILDVGAGSGFFSKHLLRHSSAQRAWCVDTSYAADADAQEAGKPVHYRRTIAQVDADLVFLMDVLEHVEDDLGLLREYVAKVPPGSRFLITVPAFQFLWSGHDEFLEHKRRYTLPQLEDTVAAAGLDIRRGAYYFGAVFPLAAALRYGGKVGGGQRSARSQLTRHHPTINALLKSLCRAELPLMNFNRLAGLTAICLAQKW